MTNHPLVVHCKNAEYDVYIGRPEKYGNPFVVGTHGTRAECCDKHIRWLDGLIEAPNGETPPTRAEIRQDLKGKRLGCWCDPKRCHGTYLATIANQRKGLFK